MTFSRQDALPQDLKTISIEKIGCAGVVTFRQAAAQNPLSEALIFELSDALTSLEADMNIHAVILVGSGDSFCAGALLGEVVHPDGVDGEFQFLLVRGFNRLAQKIRTLDLPVIGAINGNAVGGGAALALACDIAIAGENANYYFAFGRVGAASCDIGCSYFLPRFIGSMRARHWMLTGKRVYAQEGAELGLFVDVVPNDQLLDAALKMAEQIKEATPRRAASATKMATNRGETTEFDVCLDYEAYVQNYLFTTDDHKHRLGRLMKSLKMV